MDGSTGKITTLYILDDNERIIDGQGFDEKTIGSGKDLNVLKPLEDKYIKITYSDYL
jgi:hypothetical protein